MQRILDSCYYKYCLYKNKIRSFLKNLCMNVPHTIIVKTDSRNILSQMTRAIGTQ